jgi:hypothetical protein
VAGAGATVARSRAACQNSDACSEAVYAPTGTHPRRTQATASGRACLHAVAR